MLIAKVCQEAFLILRKIRKNRMSAEKTERFFDVCAKKSPSERALRLAAFRLSEFGLEHVFRL